MIKMARYEKHCWQITLCGCEESCPAWKQGLGNRPCWEVAKELNDYRNALDVCQDCIVFISKNDTAALSEAEIREIMDSKGDLVPAAQCSCRRI